MTTRPEAPHARPRRDQAAAAADLGERRLPRRRRADPARRRAPRRHRRPARRLARARRRHRQRQRRDRRGAPRLPRRRRRLRAGAARARPPAGGGRGLDVEFVEGDAEALPFPDALVRRRHVASSARCSRPTTSRRPPSCCASPAGRHDRPRELDAGRASSASSSGRSARTCPRRRACRSPMLWGTEDAPARALRRRHLVARGHRAAPSPGGSLGRGVRRRSSARWYGPTLKAFAALEAGARDALEPDLVALARRHDRLGPGATAIPATYPEAVAITR